MDPRPPIGFSNGKSCPSEPPGKPNPVNLHSQFPQQISFSHPSYVHQQFPQQHLYPQNVQYVVVQPQYAPFSLPQLPPQPAGTMSMPLPASAGTMPLPALPLQSPIAGAVPFTPVSYSGTPHSVTGSDLQDTVSVDNEENTQPDRTSKRLRLNWTELEDSRLINAWLNSFKLNSSRRNDVFWGDVAKLYNSSTPKDRRRSRKQLKPHWHKITKKMAHFYDCWCQAEKKYSSVQSDKMQMMDKTWVKYDEEARAMYLEEAKHHFTLSHLWKVVWDQPKWKNYISSLYSKGTKLSESGDSTSSSEDANDVSEKEIDEKDSMSAKKKWEGKRKMSSPSLELQQGIQSSVDPQNVLEKNNLVGDTSRLYEFQHEKEQLMARTSSFNEFHHGNSVREDIPEKGRHPQDCKVLEHAMTVRCAPEKETHPQSSKMEKAKLKRKGNISYPSSEVQEDIKHAVDLQRMLQKDREKMSEVQIQLSKEKLEMARLKHQEAKEKKETTLYEKYTELLMADTKRFNDFQKEEHQKAVKCMGVMLFGKDGK
ncbi:hypothetical protein BDA96_02G176100 [Sorghum bicolor]|uniref:Myb-like domain-containing protein n=2 Tax=Sorghum bicolor TaxID=4558 RepID=C5X9Q0_SORBI|nr:glutathione S-transferase T3 [Sorghum bicolor]EER98710.1 hypothetical protein SORBI_3002G168000 [Sorghum bicolor]KAG0543276.1 hypothetical protein BDA96_02G176100 [Sorghum bicolor]OQU89273.1 hypothetical protein SORBI_3002G168000 [Sorghum bicolor]|eukprot:XP_002462189.1 glutathione S-transferase T3 [Sorghum bicolor]